MKKQIKISDRATGPVVPVSYKAMAKRNSRANGGEAVSVVDFINEKQRGQTLQFSLTNKANEDKTFAIFPGRLSSTAEISRYAGITVDAIAAEGEIKVDDTVIATCTSKTLNLAQGWIKDHPVRFCKLKLQTDNESQFNKEIGYSRFSIGRTLGNTTIRPVEFISPDQLNKTLCEIEVSMQLDDATVFYVEVGAGRTLDLTLQIVSEMNTAMALNEMVDKLEG